LLVLHLPRARRRPQGRLRRSVPTRIAVVCGLVAPVTYAAALLLGGLAQRDEFSNVEDSISDLGADTAGGQWLYNQLGMNLTGILMVVFALGLWRAFSTDPLGRLAAGLLLLQGVSVFLEGFFPLDCQTIDAGCENTSWQSEGHRVNRFTGVFLFLTPVVLAFAFRRMPRWRDTWLPAVTVVPLFIAASAVFSPIGEGASARAGAVAWFLWLGFVALRLHQESPKRDVAGSLAHTPP
jgi:hypothetical membrane protein